MKKPLEEFEGKVVQFKIKTFPKRLKKHSVNQTGLVVKKIKFHSNPEVLWHSKCVIYTKDDFWPRNYIDMRTIKELSGEEQIIWKLEHNILRS